MDKLIPLPMTNAFLNDTCINVTPPHVDNWNISVNYGALNHITKIANINSLRINGKQSDERDEIAANISGLNSDGSASTTGAKMKQIPKFTTDLDSDIQNAPLAFRYIDANLDINMTEMSRQAAASPKGVRSPEVWAKQLNPVLKNGLQEIVVNHLMKGMEMRDVRSLVFTTIFPVTMMGIYGMTPERVLSMQLGQMLIACLDATVFSIIEKKNRFYCIDPLGPYAPQLLRSLYLTAYIKSQTLVKDVQMR